MGSFVENVNFDTIAREWRCKWNSDEALMECQKVLDIHLETIKTLEGIKDVQRVVCGGCKDFKVSFKLVCQSVWCWCNHC